MKKYLSNLETFSIAMNHYTRAPRLGIQATNRSLSALEFEKKVCRSAFRKELGWRLPGGSYPTTGHDIRVSVGVLDAGPTLSSSRWAIGKTTPRNENRNPQAQNKLPSLSTSEKQEKLGKLSTFALAKTEENNQLTNIDSARAVREKDKSFLYTGVQLFSAEWLLELLIDQIKNKRSVRAVINSQLRDIEGLLSQMQSASPVVGVRITATGRLGKKKKAMAQQISRSIGRVPLGTFRQKVDYSQGFVATKFGVVGLKVWISYTTTL